MSAKQPQRPAKADTPSAVKSLADVEDAHAKNRVTALRAKLSKAADDPDVAARMAQHIQTLLRDER